MWTCVSINLFHFDRVPARNDYNWIYFFLNALRVEMKWFEVIHAHQIRPIQNRWHKIQCIVSLFVAMRHEKPVRILSKKKKWKKLNLNLTKWTSRNGVNDIASLHAQSDVERWMKREKKSRKDMTNEKNLIRARSCFIKINFIAYFRLQGLVWC